MNNVDAIFEVNDIEKIKITLINTSYRNYMIFNVGINTGMKINDILKLKKIDINKYKFNEKLKEDLTKYAEEMNPNQYLFCNEKTEQPILVRTFWKILNQAGKKNGISNIGNNSMRKTFGYHLFLKTNNIKLVQNMLGHHSPNHTLTYLGIESYSADNINDFNL